MLNTQPLENLRAKARHIFEVGIKAANPQAAVARALKKTPIDGPTIILAVGKAACAMMAAALKRVQSKQALIVTSYENARPIEGAEIWAAGHPRPDKQGLAAGRRVKALAEAAGKNDQILLLLSGGGSALLPCPVQGISLADKQVTNDLMLSGGLPIEHVNLVRQNLSELKGGGLARLAAPAQVRSLILSDVIGDDVRAIASGPTAPSLGTREQAKMVLEAADLWADLPTSVQTRLSQSSGPEMPFSAVNQIIGSNATALDAMAAASGGLIANPMLVGDVETAADRITEDALTKPNSILLWGGETTVTLKGTGKGGRNQELSLHVLKRLQTLPRPWAFLSAGSDGIDGPIDAAGGLVDSSQAFSATLQQSLDLNDSYAALETMNALIKTGATGTNVADFQILVRP